MEVPYQTDLTPVITFMLGRELSGRTSAATSTLQQDGILDSLRRVFLTIVGNRV